MRRMFTQRQIEEIIEKSNLFAKKLYRHTIIIKNSIILYAISSIITENSTPFEKETYIEYMTSGSKTALANGSAIVENTRCPIVKVIGNRIYYLDGVIQKTLVFNWDDVTFEDSVNEI